MKARTYEAIEMFAAAVESSLRALGLNEHQHQYQTKALEESRAELHDAIAYEDVTE